MTEITMSLLLPVQKCSYYINVTAWLVPLELKKKKKHLRRHGATPSLSLQEEEASSYNTIVKTAKSATKCVSVSETITKTSEAAAEEKILPLKNLQMCLLALALESSPDPSLCLQIRVQLATPPDPCLPFLLPCFLA